MHKALHHSTTAATSTPTVSITTTALDEHLVAGLPALKSYACLFHWYSAIATPSATQRTLLGLLEAPPSWAPDALDVVVQLVELLRAAEDYATGIRVQSTAYVEYSGQFTSEQFREDIAELVRNRYPSNEQCLIDDVLATFVLYPSLCLLHLLSLSK